jgi:5-formyltetrahydrofolate cyclo-ligase
MDAIKRALRPHYSKALRALPPSELASSSAAACASLAALPEWAAAATVCLYLPLSAEPDTAPLLAATDPWVVAVATDVPALPVSVPQVHVDDIPAIAGVVFARFSHPSV